jgi:hypothetical protein
MQSKTTNQDRAVLVPEIVLRADCQSTGIVRVPLRRR